MAASINNPAWLDWMTSLMGEMPRQAVTAAFPPDRFHCLLEELPLHLLPQGRGHRLQAAQQNCAQLCLNPDCRIRAAEDLPEEINPELVSDFALQGTIAWVRDKAYGALQPFWLGPRTADALKKIDANRPASAAFSLSEIQVLAEAGVLIGEDHAEFCQEREQVIARAATQFQEKGYAPLSGLIHPFHIAALRRYYRQRIRSGQIKLGDRQSPRRYAAYNEPVARFFHHQMAATLSLIAEEPIIPSYVYFASYLSGAELRKHTDREQCEFSVTLCLDFSPEPALSTPWPISLDTNKGTVTVYQAIGDGLVYRGTQLPHYRGPLSEGQTSASIFFHYVPADFDGYLG
jgi:hypothetical protein